MLMRHALFAMLFATSLLSCGKLGPEVTVCVSRPASGGIICVTPQNETKVIPYEGTDKFVAFSPADAQKLVEACGIGNAEKMMALNFMHSVYARAESHRP